MAKQTPLNARHRALGARMLEFAGWDMPVQYSSIVQEHLAEMQTALDASKSLAYYALLERMKHDAHPDDQTQRTRSSMVTSEAKKFCTEKANECAQRTVQLLASSGISGRAAMHYMDTKVPMIYEGTSEIQKLKIAADILGPEFSAFR